MTTRRKIQEALRASLDKEDVALSRRLPAPATPRPARRTQKAATGAPTPAPAPAPAPLPQARTPEQDAAAPPPVAGRLRSVKRVRKAFSFSADELEILRALRESVRANGMRCSRSALVRAALRLIDTEDVARVREMVGNLAPLKKGKKTR